MIQNHQTHDTLTKGIIFYDADCGFCQAAVRWIKSRAREHAFSYVELQSSYAKEVVQTKYPAYHQLKTLIYLEQNEYYLRSDAVVYMAKHFKKPWHFIHWIKKIPRPLRDVAYRLIARYRHKLIANTAPCEL